MILDELALISIVLPSLDPDEKLLAVIDGLIAQGFDDIILVNDGSKDKTWEIICDLAEKDEHFIGIAQSRNRGHQNAVLAGLMEAKDKCDITISIDCDGQDDIDAIDKMVDEDSAIATIIYGEDGNEEEAIRLTKAIDENRLIATEAYTDADRKRPEAQWGHIRDPVDG